MPGFLLRRLYVKGSLRNVPEGLEFQLRNGLGSGYAHKVWPLEVDGGEVPLESCRFAQEGGEERSFADVTREATFTLPLNKAIAVRVAGSTLEPGSHRVGMAFDVPGLGTLRFDFTDVVQDE